MHIDQLMALARTAEEALSRLKGSTDKDDQDLFSIMEGTGEFYAVTRIEVPDLTERDWAILRDVPPSSLKTKLLMRCARWMHWHSKYSTPEWVPLILAWDLSKENYPPVVWDREYYEATIQTWLLKEMGGAERNDLSKAASCFCGSTEMV